MLKLFDKSFFKFLMGFTFILGLSFAVLVAVGYYYHDTQTATTGAASAESMK